MSQSTRIVFGMPEADYHAHPALSASGIKWLSVSPMDFWSRSWLNPNREEDAETEFLELGRAYHKRIVEGRDAFYASHAPALDRSEYPQALDTLDDMRERCKALGLPVSGTKAQMAERIRAKDEHAQILADLLDWHAGQHEGKTLLSHETIRRIETAAAMIENHPELRKAFTGGMPEVSIFWDEDGVPMKARLDYLKRNCIVDLKTFSNPLQKPIDIAIAQTVASRKYFIQAAVYQRAADMIEMALAEGVVEGEHRKEWLAGVSLTRPEERKFLFVFQQTGCAPLTRGKWFPRNMMAHTAGDSIFHEAVATFRRFSAVYEPGEPWVDTTPVNAFDTTEFPAYAFQG